MFSFDDRFIVFAILIPGVFLIGNSYLTVNFFYPAIVATDFDLIESIYGLVLSLLLGIIIWWMHAWQNIIDAFSTKRLLYKLGTDNYSKSINLKKLNYRYQQDFNKPLLLEHGTDKEKCNYLKGSISNMFFTMNRAFGLEKPSTYRLMLDAYAHFFIGTLLSILFFVVISTIYYFECNSLPKKPFFYLGGLTVISLLLKFGIIPELREKYHYAVIAVYLDKQYRKRIRNFIKGK